MASRYTASTKLALGILAAIFATEVYQAATQPIRSGEAYLYDRFVRPTTRQVLAQELPDRDVLYSLLEKRSVGLFHVSPFSVRLPSVLFGMLYLWSVWKLASLCFRSGWRFLVAVVLPAAVPLELGWFRRADGAGTALALVACAVWFASNRKNLNLAGACLGLAVAAHLDFAIPAAILALSLLALAPWTAWIDRVLIPAIVVAFILLVLPLSHAHAIPEITPELTGTQPADLPSALQALRAGAGSNRIRISAIPSVEPIVNFYRAQHRVTTWDRAERDASPEHFDYYLLSASQADWAQQRHLIVLYRDADFLLARRSYAPM
jgi:4-amino-4-deoxy-L-arabinose transferase-like glycosyltransferase